MSSYVVIVVNKMQVTEVWLISLHIVSGNGLSPNTMGDNLCFQLEYVLSKLEPRFILGNPNKYRLQNAYFVHLNTDKIRTSVITEKQLTSIYRRYPVISTCVRFTRATVISWSDTVAVSRLRRDHIVLCCSGMHAYLADICIRIGGGFDEGTCFLTSSLISLQNGPLCLVMGRCTYRLVVCNLKF